jgi:hypothetical protein
MKFPRGAIILLALGFACADDDPLIAPVPSPPFHDLSQKWHVLNNVEVAYNKRRIDKYDELLDNGFTFHLSDVDIGRGLPPSWGRAEELEYNVKLFDPNYTGSNRCKRIQVDLLFEDGVQWEDTIPPSAPGETWYMATVQYHFQFDMEPDDTYTSAPGAKAQFLVRDVGTGGAHRWKLAAMRDIGTRRLMRTRTAASEPLS